MKAVGYVRVSTDKQGNSVDMQPENIKRVAQIAGIDLVGIITDEDVSGGTPIRKREGGSIVMGMADRKEIDYIISTEITRMFRNTIDGLITLDELNKRDVGIIITGMGINSIDSKTSVGRLLFTFMLGTAEFEKNQIGDRTRNVARSRKDKGKVYCRLKYGFDKVKTETDHIFVPNEKEQKVIENVKEFYKIGVSLNAIADILNGDGIPTKENKRWHAKTVKELIK